MIRIYNYVRLVRDIGNTSSLDVEEHSFQLFPNPAASFIQLHSEDNIREIRIVDLTGKTRICLEKLSVKRYKLDISQLETGMYFILINGHEACLKIVKN